MTHQKPTAILIVHGAYSLPQIWDDFSARLAGAGFAVACPRLPSCQDERPPTATLTEDVMAVRHAAQELLKTGHTILALVHSYGGIVASEATTPASENTKGVVKSGPSKRLARFTGRLAPRCDREVRLPM
ncbi:hypothetical protein BO94DRAFT_623969 [Aspergillus sclerotioniger CBS 115572]|uniref:AB hydrolase-1 domain-containing protein n=1 Tax=Aspergillus sclerotioniger CBS 115572 TaxID=1450535 RepID=A0A317WR95_9EURO|nr:hypothetical protein BO94DRAFT_623969 [Aspergillus sclerotioniger CBS 115572]PWY87802.1 hypothetical protein BO94DRAFT_623969 [Aspergillus sclerotioniger CBS 115572]